MELELVKFIKSNPDSWKEKLAEKPYCIKIKEDNDYFHFKYNQIDSDFSYEIVKECRGLILNKETFEVGCYPFKKFFNIEEKNAAELDYGSMICEEKIDGSLINVWFDKKNRMWRVSTNGNISAFDSPTGSEEYPSFGHLFSIAFGVQNFGKLNKNYTYMFEVVSPYNKVVVNYSYIDIYHIGTRNNLTYEEIDCDLWIKKPMRFEFSDISQVKESANDLGFDNEGYVVRDKNYNRVKVKSPAYLKAHYLGTCKRVDKVRILDILLENESEEFLSYYPEYTKDFNKIDIKLQKYYKYLDKIMKKMDRYKGFKTVERKELAKSVIRWYGRNSDFAFLYFDNKIESKESFIERIGVKKLLERIEEC